jgi:Xaa-Pro dipeptidase
MSRSYEMRINQVKSYMREHNIEAALVTSPTNVYFFTGFFSDPHERFMALLIDLREDFTQLIVPSLDQEAAEGVSFVKNIVPVEDTEDPYQLLGSIIGSGLREIAIEKSQINLLQYERLTSIFADINLVNLESFIAQLRLNKSPEDIKIVKHAVKVAERVLEHGVKKAKLGMTELELAAELEFQMKVLGADRPAFATTVLAGSRTALPHGKPSTYKIQHGDFLLFDLGVFINGYCSDITRTFMVGEASAKQSEIYQTVLAANERAIEAVKLGESLREVDLAAREWIEAKGYGPYFIHRVGHGLGLEIHEPPSVHALNESKITPGLLFTIEPGIYVPEIGGVRIEDDIYVHADGQVEVLTTYPKELKNLC